MVAKDCFRWKLRVHVPVILSLQCETWIGCLSKSCIVVFPSFMSSLYWLWIMSRRSGVHTGLSLPPMGP